MPAKKTSRRARLIVITVVLLLVAGIGGGTFWTISTVRDSFPQTTGSLKLKGLDDPVTVQRDREGIPQVYADSSKDLFTAQGYVQAQDRFWEMDVRRHMTAGRLSEMFGDGPGQDRRVPAHARLAPGRRAGVRGPLARDEGQPQVVLGGRQRLPQGPQGLRRLPRVRGPRPLQRLQAAQVEPRRLGGLAQGDGMGPARQHVVRDRPGADVQPSHAAADRGALPGLPDRPEQAHRRRRR